MLEKTGITVDIMAGYEEVLWGRNRDENVCEIVIFFRFKTKGVL